MQCAFIGPPRSGKSTLMKRMVGERPSPSSSSTGVVNKVVQVVVRSSAEAFDSTWVKLSHDDETVMVVMDASQVAGNETHLPIKAVSQTEHHTTLLDESVSKQGKHQAELRKHQAELSKSSSTNSDVADPKLALLDDSISKQGKHQTDLSKSSSANSDVPDPNLAVSFCRSALQRNLQNAEKILRDKGWLVYLTDTGGQIEFQELLPVLVSGPSLFFLVFRLDHDLNKRFTVEYVRPNGTLSEPYQSTFTVKEALLQALASIASMVTYINRGGEQVSLKSQVFFVGTHKDMVSQVQIDRIDHALQQLVTSTGLYHKGIIQHGTKSRMLLAVNNLSDDDSDIQLVQAAVERLGKWGGFSVRAPPSWLIFSLIIRQHEGRVLSYEQCFEIARQCGILTQEELNEALWFLHTKVGLIRHFQGEGLKDLQKIVIQDPQVLFDMITDLVVETFTFDKADPVVREDFKKKGIFPFSIFERISGSSGHLLTPSRLVNLLEHLHIIAPLEEEGEKKYFMPCVLSHAQPAEAISGISGEQSAEPSSNSSSLLIGFRCGYCPKGLFAALVVYLLANKRSPFQWRLQCDRIFKDQISFSVGPYDTVSITVQPKYFEISCTPKLSHDRCFPLTTMCAEVRRCIKTGISKVTSSLHYTQDTHYLAFYCPGHHQSSHSMEPHPAEIIDMYGNILSMATPDDIVPCTLQCGLAKERAFKLPPGHERWFTKVCSAVSQAFSGGGEGLNEARICMEVRCAVHCVM